MLVDLLFPPICLGCQSLLRHAAEPPLCRLCRTETAELPEDARRIGPITALFPYDGPLQRALARLKYHGNPGWAGPLGELLAAAPELTHSPETGARWDAIVPVPLHRGRLLARGFNQTLLLAQAARRSLPPAQRLPIRPAWLQRIRPTPPQAELDAGARRNNLRGAFSVPRPRRIEGRRLLLLDDVTTTGATLATAMTALRSAGAAEVGALALMRTLA